MKNLIDKLNNYEVLFYNGFNKPEAIDLNDVVIENNYQGDVTDELMEEIEHVVSHYTIEEIIKDQPFCMDFNLWIEPSFEDLSEYNISVGLSKTDYLEDYVLKNK